MKKEIKENEWFWFLCLLPALIWLIVFKNQIMYPISQGIFFAIFAKLAGEYYKLKNKFL